MERRGLRMRIPLFPLNALHFEELVHFDQTKDSPFGDSVNSDDCYYSVNAKTLIGLVLERFELSRDDVVSIITTTDQQYVSSCLTITAFNHATVSRKLLPKTKVAIVVHEHGYVRQDIKNYIDALRSKGIFIIEDCAHVFGSIDGGFTPGTLGDVAIFSLPKVLPVRFGGVLLANSEVSKRLMRITPNPAVHSEVINSFHKFLPYWRSLNSGRVERHRILCDALGKDRVRPKQGAAPWLVYLNGVKIHENFISEVEFGATFLTNTYLVPTNPLVPIDSFNELIANISITK